ncbi:MAG: hypothetical protein HY717_13680 [Planctomycetes bacterium]|nr:hypothetical protein [Planctomycetota bacterium]
METVTRHLDKYWDGLFGHCLTVSDEDQRYLMVQRTNNLSERFFRGVKRFLRRITGKKKLNREVDALPDHALLVFNLKSQSYVELICGSLEQLPRAFAELAREGKFPKPSAKEASGRILDRKNLRNPTFPSKAVAAFAQD